eukprot:TRINITY_DN31021_c2_g1_i1.p2 TRINITY_DN31021_c2_g1~~TRINITY_DN31021_c2_g1_i1.p2  ORF type:complete len:188 (+),score=62.88 TRINITY_DN31021_c2_g1_i1:213-776(+)
MIDPGTAQDGEDYHAYNRRRWGGDGWTQSLRQRGKEVGCPFRGWRWWPNTMNAHSLCVLLEQQDAADPSLSEADKERRGLELMDKLYELNYERGENVSTVEGCLIAARELGFPDAGRAEGALQGGEAREEVARRDRLAKAQRRISGVPYFLISVPGGAARPLALSGAQSASALRAALEQALQGAGAS